MAIVEGPALSLRASGNVGALCYAPWRGVFVARAANPAVQPWTTLQRVYTTNMALVRDAWSFSCTEMERLAWDAFALGQKWSNRLGLRWQPMGYQMFLKMNCQALALGGSIQTAPPAWIPGTLPALWEVLPNVVPGRVTIELSGYPAGEEPDLIQVFRAGPFLRVGRHARKPDYRFQGLQGLPYVMTQNGLLVGQYYWFKARWGFNIGVVGNFFEAQVLVT